MSSIVLQRVTVVGDGTASEACDVTITNGTITAVEPTGVTSGVASHRDLAQQPNDVIDLDGYLLLASAVEPHAHLDKAFLAEVVPNPTGDLDGAIAAMAEHRHLLGTGDTVTRAERAARLMARNGYRAVRTHADVTLGNGLTSIEALLAVKQCVADVIDMEIVALAGWPVIGPQGADQRALLREALQAGADLVGGCPHLEAALSGTGDTASPTEYFLDLATEFGVGVDLHTDETLDPTAHGLADLARLTAAGFEHQVTASHCVSLDMQPLAEQQATAEMVAAAGIGVIALPHTNLFLQGRGHHPMPRGLTAVDTLRRAGVSVAAGADNLQDPFNPVGRACPFETASLMILTSHLLPGDAWQAVTATAAAVTGFGGEALTVGASADLVAVRAATLREAIATGPSDRMIWRRGVLQTK